MAQNTDNNNKNFGHRSVPGDILKKVQAFIDAEWIAPAIPGDAVYSATEKTLIGAPRLFSRRDAGYGGYAESRGLCEEADTLTDYDLSESFEDIIGPLGQTFQEKLLALIDARGMKDPEVYSRANIDRRLFSKIRSNKNYKPSKPTALAFAIALSLNIDETTDLLQRAGLALSPSSKADLIVKYCILNKIYDIMDVNGILYEYDQPLLGC